MAIALWRHGGGARHNDLFVMTASNINSWAAVLCWANDFHSKEAWLWLVRHTKKYNVMGQLWSYQGLELSNRGMNWLHYAI